MVSSFDIISPFPNSDLPWNPNNLAGFLEHQNPIALPNVKRMSNALEPAFPDECSDEYAVIMEADGKDLGYVLRVDKWHEDHSVELLKLRLHLSHMALERLTKIGRQHGIGKLVLPYIAFISRNDPYTREQRPDTKANTLYTIVEKVPHGQNLGDSLSDPNMQPLLHRLGATQVASFEQLITGEHAAMDATDPFQYSTEASLYDVSHSTSNNPVAIGAEVEATQAWVGDLLPAKEKDHLLSRLSAVAERYPVDD